MPPSSWRIRLSSLWLAAALAAGQTPTPPPAKKAPVKPVDTVPAGPPMTLTGVVRMLSGVKQGITDHPRVLAFVNKRGIDFAATSENMAALTAAGATQELLDRVMALKPPPPPPAPPPPPKPVTGKLRVSCEPAECGVSLNGGAEQSTSGGKLEIGELPYQEYGLEFRKSGYEARREKLRVSSENPTEFSVILQPLPETKAAWGKQLLSAMEAALGGTAPRTLNATGGASSWNEQGSQSEWSFHVAIGTQSVYELSNPPSGTFSLTCQGETCNPTKGKNLKKNAAGEAAALNTNLRQFHRYHLAAVLQRVSAGGFQVSSDGSRHLLAASGAEAYEFMLDEANLPVTVHYRSSDGLASATVTYGDYAEFGNGAKYPRLTSIALPGEKQHGIRAKFDAVRPSGK
jgi:hypothetical protein